ncbi:MAG TPA: hypothetical protein VFA68_05795 [Terriglobales bacterium]|nr:hypothetical protein [Terriglobales bacterium]
MTEKKKREKVTAEITLAHLVEFAQEAGMSLNREEAVAFFNQNGRAYAMWKQMMQAGEEYIKETLKQECGPIAVPRPGERRRMVV